jgi:hypothetical protein
MSPAAVLPRSQNFGCKGNKKVCWARKIRGQTFGRFLEKRAEKGTHFFVVWLCTKTVKVLAENCNFPLVYSILLAILHCESLKQPIILASLNIFYEVPKGFARSQIL